jgi:hypothetical protein
MDPKKLKKLLKKSHRRIRELKRKQRELVEKMGEKNE